MQLKDLVIQKINELGGPENATEFFGKSEGAIRSWTRKGGVIPMDAVQKVLDSQSSSAQTEPQSAPQEEAQPVIGIRDPLPPTALPPTRLESLQAQVDNLQFKLGNIEYFLQNGQMPQVAQPAGYGFRPSPVPNTVVPPGIPLQASQINTAVAPQLEPTLGSNAPVTPGKGAYLPSGNSWCQPHPPIGTPRL